VFVDALHGFDDGLGDMAFFDERPSHSDDEIHRLQTAGTPNRTGFTRGTIPQLFRSEI